MPPGVVQSRPSLLLLLRQLQPDLTLVGEDGLVVKVNSSLIAVLSPMIAKLLALNPGSEGISLPISMQALFAFHAIYVQGSDEERSPEEEEHAKDVCELLQVDLVHQETTKLAKLEVASNKKAPFSKIIVRLDARKIKSKQEIKEEVGNTLPGVDHLQEEKVKVLEVKGKPTVKRSYKKNGSRGPFVCEKCPKIMESRETFYKHKISHLEKVVPCNQCDTKFRTNSSMELHTKNKHSQGRVCTICGDIFKYLEKHLKGSKCGLGEKLVAKHLCSLCPKKFTLLCGLRYHEKNIHKKIKNYECNSCGYKTYSRSNLAMHVGSQHEGRKLEKKDCPFCKKRPYMLDTHIARYHGMVSQ